MLAFIHSRGYVVARRFNRTEVAISYSLFNTHIHNVLTKDSKIARKINLGLFSYYSGLSLNSQRSSIKQEPQRGFLAIQV